MKRFYRTVSAFPFVGKFAIGKELFEVYEATSLPDRRKEFREAVMLLICMVIAHAAQAFAGGVAMLFDAPWYAKVYFGLYALANASVTLTQIWLLWRVSDFHFTKPAAETSRMSFRPHKMNIMKAYTFTVVAQVIFIMLYTKYAK